MGSSALRPRVVEALDLCFEAVLAPDLWPEATEALTASLGGLGGCFHMQGGLDSRRMLAPMTSRYLDMLDEFLDGGWGPQDLRALRGWPLAAAGRPVVLERDITTPEERARTAIYQDLFRRHDMDMIIATSFVAKGRRWVFNVLRSEAMPEPDAADLAELTALGPILSRLVTLAHDVAGAASDGAMDALEDTGSAAILVDWTGRVTQVNAPARALLDRGLSLRSGRLTVERPDDQARLDALVAAAVGPDGLRAGAGPVAVRSARGDVLLIDAIAARRAMSDAFGQSAALLLLSDPGRRPRPSEGLLRQVYGLTPRETEVALMIAAGDSVTEIADVLGLMPSSVRQVLKAVFWKTGAGRQSELASMLARLPERR